MMVIESTTQSCLSEARKREAFAALAFTVLALTVFFELFVLFTAFKVLACVCIFDGLDVSVGVGFDELKYVKYNCFLDDFRHCACQRCREGGRRRAISTWIGGL